MQLRTFAYCCVTDAYLLDGEIKESWDFKVTLFVDNDFRNCTSKYVYLSLLDMPGIFLDMSTSTNKVALKPQSYIITPSNIHMGICARHSFSHSWGSVIPFVNFQEFSSWYNSISWLGIYLNQGFRELSKFFP